MMQRLMSIAERQLHLIIAGNWEAVDPELVEYLEDELENDPREDLVGVAFCLLKMGISPEKAVSLLSWKEFESFCMKGLQIQGMEAFGGVRFKQGGRRYEIDVLGIGEDKILLIDCKMWSMRGRSNKMRLAAEEHLRRAIAFDEAMRSEKIRGFSKEEGRSNIIPIVVSWLEVTLTRSREGLAVVSLRDFPRFLDSLDELEDDFFRIETNYRIRAMKGFPSRGKLPLRS